MAPAKGRGDLPHQLDGGLLLGAGPLEEEQGGHRLLLDLARLEDRQDLGRDPLQLLGPALPGDERSEIEGDQGQTGQFPIRWGTTSRKTSSCSSSPASQRASVSNDG